MATLPVTGSDHVAIDQPASKPYRLPWRSEQAELPIEICYCGVVYEGENNASRSLCFVCFGFVSLASTAFVHYRQIVICV